MQIALQIVLETAQPSSYRFHLQVPASEMKLVEDKGGAVALMIAALIFLGTWPALLNLLERRGRNPVHTYLDYSVTNFLMAVIIAFTLGQIGDAQPGKPNFTTQLAQVYKLPALACQHKTPSFDVCIVVREV